jgi:hypothetical protein
MLLIGRKSGSTTNACVALITVGLACVTCDQSLRPVIVKGA